ncbi:MAG: type V CRISPR-associated protein Cas4 [Erysipelotrichaceae bacterium]|nr:type V CRISPR-associated protein Cas4 [Erysipelotrichaceae bacterium]
MENPIIISNLNDFVFCPASIYFHNAYSGVDELTYQTSDQINGKAAHETIDTKKYTGAARIQSIDVYCEKYNLIGKIDLYDSATRALTERKKKISKIYDGQVFQLYGQYFAMTEMGYDVEKLLIHSLDDNKTYDIDLPENDPAMMKKFENLIKEIELFNLNDFRQNNPAKCLRCIYEPMCDRSV